MPKDMFVLQTSIIHRYFETESSKKFSIHSLPRTLALTTSAPHDQGIKVFTIRLRCYCRVHLPCSWANDCSVLVLQFKNPVMEKT